MGYRDVKGKENTGVCMGGGVYRAVCQGVYRAMTY